MCCSVLQCVAVCCSVLQCLHSHFSLSHLLACSNTQSTCGAIIKQAAKVQFIQEKKSPNFCPNCRLCCLLSHSLLPRTKKTLQHNAILCNTLQYTATNCNKLQHTATRNRRRRRLLSHSPLPLSHLLVHPNTQGMRRAFICSHTATHCNTLQHTATHCNTLQHTATHNACAVFPSN